MDRMDAHYRERRRKGDASGPPFGIPVDWEFEKTKAALAIGRDPEAFDALPARVQGKIVAHMRERGIRDAWSKFDPKAYQPKKNR